MHTLKQLIITPLLLLILSGSSTRMKPEVQVLTSGTKTSLRGLSVVNDNIIWVSGSRGMVGRSVNAGKNFTWFTVKGFEKTEFRDIEGFDEHIAVIMSVDSMGHILKTTDGGETWKTVYENNSKGMFLDAMDFADSNNGMVIGDPINGNLFIAATNNGGESWTELKDKTLPADSGEAFFAASGTNIRMFNGAYFFVSGGKRSRLFTSKKNIDLPIIQGKESTGANSIAVYDAGNMKGSDKMVVVGGDFTADTVMDKNCFYSKNGGKDWKYPATPPHGYRSCVEFVSKKDLFCCGLNGVDYSTDAGKNWTWISKEGFNVCRISKKGSSIFLAGNNGKIGKISWK